MWWCPAARPGQVGRGKTPAGGVCAGGGCSGGGLRVEIEIVFNEEEVEVEREEKKNSSKEPPTDEWISPSAFHPFAPPIRHSITTYSFSPVAPVQLQPIHRPRCCCCCCLLPPLPTRTTPTAAIPSSPAHRPKTRPPLAGPPPRSLPLPARACVQAATARPRRREGIAGSVCWCRILVGEEEEKGEQQRLDFSSSSLMLLLLLMSLPPCSSC